MQRIKNEQSKPWQLTHICMHKLPFSLSGISIVLGETVYYLNVHLWCVLIHRLVVACYEMKRWLSLFPENNW